MRKIKLQKIIILAVVVLLVMVVASGCKSQTSETTAAVTTAAAETTVAQETVAEATTAETTAAPVAEGPWKFGVANLTYQHSFYVGLREIWPAVENNYNATIENKSCDFKLEQQISDIDNLIQMGMDVIGVNPVDSVAIEPAVQKIVDAGIPCFSIANVINVEGNVNAILSEYDRFADNAHIIAALMGFKGKVFYASGMIGNWASDQRQAGFLETIAQYPDIKVEWGPTDWNAEKATALAEGWLAANDDIDAIVAVGETEGGGVLQAVKNAGRLADIMVITDGGEPLGIEQVQAGETVADGLISPDLFWWWIAQSAYLVKNGTTEKNLYMPVPHVLTQETYDKLVAAKMKGIEKLSWVTPEKAVEMVATAVAQFGIDSVKK